jgi:para-nitrobenzyl esterase
MVSPVKTRNLTVTPTVDLLHLRCRYSAMQPVVSIAAGNVRGQVRAGISRFLGIPYAAAPVGELRFAAPAPAPTWDRVRDALTYGPTAPKAGYTPPFDSLLNDPSVPGDEWLNLNVWTPGGSGLPVMVWIHGGAFFNGSSAVPSYDGQNFARDGVVCVTLNYRLGVDGFAYIADAGAPANRGLLDQIAALTWVRDNIAAFGGDPARVTMFGQSAGAMSVTSLLAMPAARGLFHRAITQSGAAQAAATVEDAAGITVMLADRLGAPATAAGLAGVDIPTLAATARSLRDEFSAASDKSRYGRSIIAAAMPFIPVIDAGTLPAHPMAAIASGASSEIPLMTGATTDEENFFLTPTGVTAALTDDRVTASAAGFGAGLDVLKIYRANRPDSRPGDVLSAVLTDAYFRLPALAVADARVAANAETFVYEFAQRSPVQDLGACHGLDVGYVFDNLGRAGNGLLAGSAPSQALADEMHAVWVRFAHTGDPGWPRYDESRLTMIFADPAVGVTADPRGDERAAWS